MVQNTAQIGLSSGSLRLASQAETPQSHPFMMTEEQLWHEGRDFWEGQQPGPGGMAGSDILQAAWLWPSSPAVQAVQALGTQLPGGSRHGYWEEEAIWVEIKVSMTPWLDGSRWLCPLESELWYNTRLLEDAAEANEVTSCQPSPRPPQPHLPISKRCLGGGGGGGECRVAHSELTDSSKPSAFSLQG